MKIEIAVDIAAPPAAVYATISAIARLPDFVRGIERMEILTAGPVGVGTTFRETRTMFGRNAAEEMTVAQLKPPHRFDLTAENHGTRYLIVHDIAPAPDGARLRLMFEGAPVTLAAKAQTDADYQITCFKECVPMFKNTAFRLPQTR